MVGDIPAGDGKIANIFLQCRMTRIMAAFCILLSKASSTLRSSISDPKGDPDPDTALTTLRRSKNVKFLLSPFFKFQALFIPLPIKLLCSGRYRGRCESILGNRISVKNVNF